MCVCVIYLPNFCLNFVDLQFSGMEKKTFHHRFLLPQSKNTYSKKGLNTPTPKVHFRYLFSLEK